MIDQVLRWAPSVKNIYVRASGKDVKGPCWKNGVNIRKIPSGYKRSQSVPNKVSQKLTRSVPFEIDDYPDYVEEQEWMSAAPDTTKRERAKSIHEMISNILEMEEPSKELMDSIEAFEKWGNVRDARELYKQI